MSKGTATADYIMEDPREAMRLELKVDPTRVGTKVSVTPNTRGRGTSIGWLWSWSDPARSVRTWTAPFERLA